MSQQNQVRNKLNNALTSLIETLQEFAGQSNFWKIFDTAFGQTYNQLRVKELRTQWRLGDKGALPLVEIVNQEVLGISLGAYSIDTDKIYMSEQFVVAAKLADLVLVLLEEYGHHIDAQVNAKDTPGDEGEIFAALVLGKTLDDESLRNLRAEDDSAVIALGGEVIKIEQATFTGSNSNDRLELLGSALVSNDTYDGGGGIDTLIADYSSASFGYLNYAGYGVTNMYTDSFEALLPRLWNWNREILVNYSNIEIFEITGTAYADYIRGYGGDDKLIGGEGNDDIAGGDGNDLIRGGDGNDILKGEGGDDEIEGGHGNDTIDGGTGRQVINGGTGDDIVVSAKAGDSIDGGEGSDTLQSLDLTSLDIDLVLDLRATEQVSGDNNTRINNFESISSVTLGSGYDTIIATGNLLVSNGSINSGGGIDTLIADYSSASFGYLNYAGYGVTNMYTDSFEALLPRLWNWNREILVNYSNIEIFEITGTAYADYIRGYGGDDKLIGGEGNDDIAGGDGNDLIRGGDGNDILKGEGGDDEIEGGHGNDTIDGGTGRQVINGGTGDDIVVSAKAGDSIDGGEGSDTLQSLDLTSLDIDLVLDLRATEQVSGDNNTRINNFESISSVTLGSGYDTIIATGNLLVSNGSINSGGGIDTLIADYSSASFGYLNYAGYGVTNMYTDSFEALLPRLWGWNREILVNYSNIEIFEITGTAYADYIRGYGGDDKLIGGEGNDDIAGGDGNDLIRGGDGNDILKGEGGDDEIEGGHGNDTIDGGTGRQVINGGTGDDIVVSAKAGDSIDGGEGSDTLQSLDLTSLDIDLVLDLRATEQISGDNNTRINNFESISSVTLGSGYDTIIATGNLLISNGSINSGGGIDTLIADYSSASFGYLNYAGYGVTNMYTDSFEALLPRLWNWNREILVNYSNIEIFEITGTAYADYLRGYSGDDKLIGGEGNDDIAGGDGNDLIRGGDGNDILKGEGGDDEIEGGHGNDTIDGGTGRQVINGGTGDDIVVSAKAGDSIDGGEGSDTLQSLDLTSLEVDLVLDLRATEQISGDNNTRINNFESISSVTLGSGYDTIIATGNLLVSNGSINSGGGTDTLIADYSSASFGYLNYAGYGVTNMYTDSFEALLPRLWNWNREILVNYSNIEIFEITGTAYADYLRGYSGDDKLIGGEGNDDIAGGDGNDLIILVNPNIAKPGLGTVDTVTGGAGLDTFILGDATGWVGYDDYNLTNAGEIDYLNIKDFNPQEDIIQLLGSSSDYTTTVSGNNINLYINKPDSEPDELIAVLENTQGLINPSQFSLNGSYFKYVTSDVVLDITSTFGMQTEGNSGNKLFIFTVNRTGDTNDTSTVDWFVTASGDNLVNSTDFGGAIPPGETLTFLPGETSKEIRLRVRGDSTIEPNETFTVYLSTATRATIGTRTATGTILDDDGSQPTTLAIAPSSAVQLEGDTGTKAFTFTVTRSGNTTGTSSANWAVTGSGTNQADATDFGGTLPSGTVNFAAGETGQTITVNVSGDTMVESDEGFTVTLSNSNNATITTVTATGTITNDDIPSITLAVSPSSVVEDGTTNLVYTFTRTGPTTNTLAVNYTIGGTATNGSDYNNIGTSVTFAAGSSTATVTVDPTANTTPESDETVIFTLASGTGYTIGTTSGVTGTITNDDLGDNQQITSTSNRLRATPSATLTVPLLYNTSNSNNSLNGIGIRLHYDSSDLSYQQVTNLLSTNLFGAVSDNLDNQNFDKDNTTDRYIQIQYFATNGNWPNKSLPVKLGDFAFTTSTNFQETQLNITSVSAAPGYTLEAAPIEIYKQNWTLDVDGNYTSDALSDGIMIMRYLFGNFPGDALTRNAIASNATRTSSEIRTYLGEAGSILDIDGDGKVTPLSDGIMAVRYLFGGTFTGNALINGAISPNATRNLSQIESYLASISGTSSASPFVPQQTTLLPLFAQTFNTTSSSKQIIDLTTSNSSLTPVSIGVTYNVDSADNTLTGIGIRLHYNSNQISYQSASNLLSTDLFGDVTDNLDEQDLDGDTSTNRYIQIQYADFNGNWPNQNLPVKIGDFAFNTVSSFQQSKVNVTAVDVAPGYTLQARPLTLVGNGQPKVISGTDQGDDINATTGQTTVTPGKGDDIIRVNSASVVIIELPNEGNDTVFSSINYNLASLPQIENLTLSGTEDINGIGNRRDNVITGNSGQNVLTGLQGNDTFVFNLGDSVVGKPDRIGDFQFGKDKIRVNGVSPSVLTRASNNSASTLSSLVDSVFIDGNGALDGNQGLGTNSAALVVSTAQGIGGTYLIVNDGVGGFNPATDLVINLTGYSSNLPDLGNIAEGSVFV
ncbi:Calx-beta domain-containing protein [Cylindrospermopsis raciborskii G7]|uniref:Calx-beta domain-containing protein n=2 Tax=Cylindrospermopsis TaxID=77021 RepID=UPI003EBE3FAA